MSERQPRSRRARTRASNAGQPQTNANAPAAASAPPTDEELDQREQRKTGPRRPAGPPLGGDHPEPAPMVPLSPDLTPDPTDPAEQ